MSIFEVEEKGSKHLNATSPSALKLYYPTLLPNLLCTLLRPVAPLSLSALRYMALSAFWIFEYLLLYG